MITKKTLEYIINILQSKNAYYYILRNAVETDRLFKKFIIQLSASWGDIFKQKNGYVEIYEYWLIWKNPDQELYPIADFNAPLIECNWRNLHFKILKQND